MIKTKLSKILCGVVAVAIAGTVMVSAADPVSSFTAEEIRAGQGTMSSDAEGNVILKHNPNNTADHAIYSLEKKDAEGNIERLDGSKSYTIVVEARLDSYDGDEQGMKATENDARVFGLDPKIRDADDRANGISQDPVEGWFTVEQMTGNTNIDETGFGKYYVVITPENAYYEAVDGINIEHRIRFMAAADNMFANIAIRSLNVYEGEIKVEGGVRSQDNLPKEDEDDTATTQKPGTSQYGKKGQKAKYKGSNKDLVDGDFDLPKAGTNQIVPKATAGATADLDATDADTDTDTTITDTSVDSTVTDETIPQAGSEGAGMIVLAMVAAAAIGGTAISLGKKKRK